MAGFTEAQKECIESTASRLVISAGAGTGKTFTITQKIAHMLASGHLDSIEEVLAITFTNKAAGEIKARVRSTLRARGLYGQALLVDGAWVGTIHGMCARMLRENALDIGVSPSFAVLDDIDASNLLEESLEEALASARSGGATRGGSGQGGFDALFADHPKSGEVAGIVTGLIEQAKKSPEGFDSIVLPPDPRSPHEIASGLLAELREALLVYDGCACSTQSFEDALTWTVGAIDNLDPLCAEMRADASGRDFGQDLADVLESIGAPKKIRGKKFPEAIERSVAAATAFDAACAELEGRRAQACLHQALELARLAEGIYAGKKRDRGLMDNDDLLVVTYRALRDTPNMAAMYRNRFRLVLVDEFQDTSDLQIAIVEQVCGPRAQLCTVGDAQQSIYRFRGADVNVYRRFIAQSGVRPVELGLNFRSHGDILRFSNSIFGLPGVFDDMYLPLEPGRESQNPDFNGLPRVDVISVQYGYHQATVADMRRFEAAQVAERFARYRDAGISPGDMVVLMGRMTASQTYADALAARGFEVVIAGGSGFWESDECKLVDAALRVLANPLDDEGLYRFLEAGVVPIGDNDLLDLVSGGEGRRRRLSLGFGADCEELSPQIRLARGLVERAAADVGRHGVAGALERLLVEAGMVERLDGESSAGAASWANILKALRFVRQLEEDKGLGVAGVSALFSQHCAEGSKEGPGFLAQEAGDAVRIMTIHASKGLEFPVVALVEYASSWTPTGLRSQSKDARTYVLLGASSKSDADTLVHKRAGEFRKVAAADECGADWSARLAGSQGYPGYVQAFNGFAAEEELAEAKRKFYVGVTRASEALIVGASFYAGKNSPAPGGLLDDLRRAIFGADAFAGEDAAFDFGGTIPGAYSFLRLVRDEESVVRWEGNEDYELPAPPVSSANAALPPEPSGSGIAVGVQEMLRDGRFFSYSSIAPDLPEIPAELRDPLDDESSSAGLNADEDSATEFGLAFHAAAEHMALAGLLGGGNAAGDHEPAGTGSVSRPDWARVEAIASFHGLSDGRRDRLLRAVDAWAGSSLASRAAGYRRIRAEVPFCLAFPAPSGDMGAEPLLVNGEIDLLCSEPGGSEALVIDYKTGGDDAESPEYLLGKHRLQSLCYAYATLATEFESVEIAFVRVERIDVDGEPQTVVYSYCRDDLPSIIEQIQSRLMEQG